MVVIVIGCVEVKIVVPEAGDVMVAMGAVRSIMIVPVEGSEVLGFWSFAVSW